MTPQLWTLLAVLGLFLVSLAATRPRTRRPLVLLVLVAAIAWALGAI